MTPNSPHYHIVSDLKANAKLYNDEKYKDAVDFIEQIADAYEERIRDIKREAWNKMVQNGTDGFHDLVKEALRPL